MTANRTLIISVFIVASCGLAYELIIAALASYLLGDSILQFSSVIGLYLFSMGIGAHLTRYIKDEDVLHRFIEIELLVGIIGGISALALFVAFGLSAAPFRTLLYAFVLIVGAVVGMEIPLVMRVLNRKGAEFKELVSKVLTFDYLGALAVSLLFPLLLAPKLGMARSALLFGILNAAVAYLTARVFKAELPRYRAIRLRALIVLSVLAAAFAYADRISFKAEQSYFGDPVVYQSHSHYQPLFVRSIRLRGWIIGSTVVLFVLAVGIFSRMGGEFIPQLQEGDFVFECILPPGTSLKQSLETSMQASRLIREFDEVKMVIGKTGSAEIPTDPMPLEASDIVIVLKSQDQWKSGRSYEELGDAIIERLKDIPGVFFEKSQPIQMHFNELMTGVRQDVTIKIFGENMDTLAHYAQRVSQLIQKTEGATAPQVEKVSGLPQINVTYDRVRLANYGLSVQEVNEVLSTAFAGKKAGVVFENERRFDLVVRLDSLHRTGIDDVQHMMVATENGQVPMSQLATIKYELGPAQVSREAGKRRIVIGFNVQGRDVQSVVSDIEQKLKGVKLPTGYYFTYGGQFENLQQATDRLLIAVPVALLLIFFLLYLAFHSIKQSLLIFSAIPMSAIGGVFALLLRGMPFSISAGIGFIALFGVAVLNGIVLIGTFNQLKKEGMTNLLHRVITGTEMRLRPVLMTAMVASLGFLPMALSQGAGAEVQRPLATVVIGGLVSATFLTLFVLPLLYIAFNSTFSWRRPSAKVLTIALLLISPIALHAQQSYSLQEIEQIALKNNGVIKAAQLKLQGASAKERTSFELAKTDFTGQYGQYSSAEKDLSVGVSQSIPLPTVFAARKKLYQAETQLQQGQLALQQNELKRQVRNAYQQLQYLTFKEEQLLQLDSLYNNFIRIAEVRYKAGDTKKIDINTAQVKKGEISLLLQQNKTIQQATYRNLRTLMQTEEAFTITKSPVPGRRNSVRSQ